MLQAIKSEMHEQIILTQSCLLNLVHLLEDCFIWHQNISHLAFQEYPTYAIILVKEYLFFLAVCCFNGT